MMEKLTPAERLIVALDVDTIEKASSLARDLVSVGVTHFKIGLGLFTLVGPSAVEEVHRLGGKVFLDLKFHDIPNTVAQAVASAVRLSIWMTNLHIQGGSVMMRQAVASAREEAARRAKRLPLLVGVTVLTSMSERDLIDLGIRKTPKDQVLYLTKLAKSSGLDGLVASAQEAKVIRFACGDGFLLVTPGIRPVESEDPFQSALKEAPLAQAKSDDQQRTATPAQAIQAGADYLVVGRPILEAKDPVKMAQEIIQMITRASHA